MSTDEYDYAGYEKSLERVLSLSEKDYWTQYVDINNHQVNVSKTYLWVSAALVGAYVTVFDRYGALVFGGSFTITFALLSILSSAVAFGLCLYAIPARDGYRSIPSQSWGEFSLLANNLLHQKEKNIYISVLTNLVDKVDSTTFHNVSTNQKRAKLLRATSWVLLSSLVFAVLTTIGSYSNHYLTITTQLEKTTMTNENNESSNAPSVQQSNPGPGVPTPAGPISSASPQSVRVTNTETRITESAPVRMTDGTD